LPVSAFDPAVRMALILRRTVGWSKNSLPAEDETSAKRLNASMLLHYKQCGRKKQEVYY